jgi:ribosomal-protein-alanine N-acetyltransferase
MIKGRDLSIRPFNIKDFNKTNYFKWLSNPEITKYIYRKELGKNFNKKIIIKNIKKLINSKNNLFFLILYKKKAIGTSKIGNIDWLSKNADLGIMIGDKDFFNKGVAKEILKKMINLSFKKLYLRKLTAGCFKSNIAMKKVFLKLDFVIEGTLKKQFLINNKLYDDQILFALFNKNKFNTI